MPRTPKPWFWEKRGEWCVNINGVRHRLGDDKEEADQKFHALMANPDRPICRDSVAGVVDEFLDWTKKNRKPDTFDWYQKHLQSFLSSLKPKTLVVGRLKSHHVHSWTDAMTCGDTMKRGALTAVSRAFNWAVEMGHIGVNPIPKLKKPAASNRDLVISPEEYQEILKHVTGGFRDLIVTAWETGARPQEITRVEARNVDLKNSRWFWPKGKAPKGKDERSIYLSETALAITKRLMLEHPTGAIFRNVDEEPWTSFATNCSFLRLQAAMGRQDIEISNKAIASHLKVMQKRRKEKGKNPLPDGDLRWQAKKALIDAAARKNATKYFLYAFRYSYCTHGLMNGTDPVTMGKLMGHADLTMIYKIYAKIAKDPVFMLSAARKVAK
jgi:integrase